jgi:hypothetical protein
VARQKRYDDNTLTLRNVLCAYWRCQGIWNRHRRDWSSRPLIILRVQSQTTRKDRVVNRIPATGTRRYSACHTTYDSEVWGLTDNMPRWNLETANRDKYKLSPSPHSYKGEGSSARHVEIVKTPFADSPHHGRCCGGAIKKAAPSFQTHGKHEASSSGHRTKS